MRLIHMWNISADVQEALAAGKSIVKIGSFADSRLLSAVTVGKDHNYIKPGHYVIVDHADEGEKTPVSLRIVPARSKYKENTTVEATFIGTLIDVNDSVPCVVFQLTDSRREYHKEMSVTEQDLTNS